MRGVFIGFFMAFIMLPFVVCAGEINESAIKDIYILSDIDKGEIEVRVIPSDDAVTSFANVRVDAIVFHPSGSSQTIKNLLLKQEERNTYLACGVVVDPVLTWDPRDAKPHLYTIQMTFKDKNGSTFASCTRRFGMRKFATRNGKFYVNNQPFYVRACGHEPEEFLEKLDRWGIEKRLKQVKRYGFNTVRHHSHVPSDVYLDIADEVGLLIQMEIHGKIGTDAESERFEQSRLDWISMIERGRRHPCTFIYSIGNEIYKNDPGLISCQNILYDLAKKMDPSVLVLNRSGSNPFNDNFGKYDLIERPIGEYEHVAEFAREAFELYLRGPRKGKSDEVPIIAHEYPLVASYPNIELAHKYDEEPFWLKITRENAQKNGLLHLLPEFVKNSEAIQNLCRKEMLEEARKFPELDGYSMLRFTDNESKVSGVVDDFADPKNVTAAEFLRTNGETVLLCTWNERCFKYGDTLEVRIEISHHGTQEYRAPKCLWWLMQGANVLAEGSFDNVKVAPVNVATVGTIKLDIPSLQQPSKLTLRAALPNTIPYINNEWYFWAFPDATMKIKPDQSIILWDPRKRMKTYLDTYPDIAYIDDDEWRIGQDENPLLLITDSWQEEFYEFLDRGGNMWMISDKSWPWPEEIGIFGLHITKFIPADQAPPVFPELDELCNKWLTICSNSKTRHGNSGTVIYPHPPLGNFPHEGFCDLHFWPLIYRAKVLQLDRFPEKTMPIIRAIDNYYRSQRKAYMVELGVGEGRILVSTLNFTQSFPRALSTRYMFDRVLQYLLTGEKNSSVTMTPDELRKMIDDFAVELASREPLTHDEMPARYTTRWKWLLSPFEQIILQIYDAAGINEDKLSVHWEYAQTQWYYDAAPGEHLVWEFNNETSSDFTAVLNFASPFRNITLDLKVDENPPVKVVFNGSDGWLDFVPAQAAIENLKRGKHTLSISIPVDAPARDDVTIQIREILLQANQEPTAGTTAVFFVPVNRPVQEGEQVGTDPHRVYRRWDAGEQQALYNRAGKAARLVPMDVVTSDLPPNTYLTTPEHDELKEELAALVDNEEAWPEYIYFARLIGDGSKYEILCSSSDIIETNIGRQIEINENMQRAIELGQPYVTDLFNPLDSNLPSTHAAVYYPFFKDGKPVGIMVFVKGYWKSTND